MISARSKSSDIKLEIHNIYTLTGQGIHRSIRAINRGNPFDYTLRMTVPEGGDWYTDDSMKLIEQETYTLEDAH